MRIGIIALGLIGGSLLKALSGKDFELVAVSRDKTTLKAAKSYTDNVSDDISAIKDCDMVFVCTPISKTSEMLDKLEKIVSEDCIVTDVASVKGFLSSKKRPYKFIGSHPMAGTENKRFKASSPELFKGAKWVITPTIDTMIDDIEKLKNIIEMTGADLILADANEHDEAVALISHMPMLVAQAIFKTATNSDLALELAASGFRDMTRLAMTNTELAQDMMTYNGQNIKKACNMLSDSLSSLQDKSYVDTITAIKALRERMYSTEGKNILK